MKKYILTAPKMTGAITVGFDVHSYVVFYHNEADLDERQKRWLLNNFPFTEQHLTKLKELLNGQLEEVATEITFEVFWEKYGKKINKKRCEAVWKKMTDTQKAHAVLNIWVYDRYLTRTGFRAKVDPEKYLGSEYYLNDWSKEK